MINRFVVKLSLGLMPIMAIVIFVNYFGDAANLFKRNYEKRIAQELIKGNNITGIVNFDERLLQKHLISNIKNCPDVLVLGSSRTMMIDSGYFEKNSFLNCSVSGATLQDLMAIFQLFDSKDCLPQKVILGIDGYTLNGNNKAVRWRTLELEYKEMLDKTDGQIKIEPISLDLELNKFYQLVSPSYFQSSMKALNSKGFQITTDKYNQGLTKLTDGSITYGRNKREASVGEVTMRALRYTNSENEEYISYSEISANITHDIEKFVKYLISHDIEPILFLAPYHPLVYSHFNLETKYSMVSETENYFNSLASRYEIEIVGSFDPSALGLESSHFLDGVHLNKKGLEEFFKREILNFEN